MNEEEKIKFIFEDVSNIRKYAFLILIIVVMILFLVMLNFAYTGLLLGAWWKMNKKQIYIFGFVWGVAAGIGATLLFPLINSLITPLINHISLIFLVVFLLFFFAVIRPIYISLTTEENRKIKKKSIRAKKRIKNKQNKK